MIKIKGFNKVFFLVFNILLLNTFIANKCYAYIKINVNETNYNPIPMVMFDFVSDEKTKKFTHVISNKISGDLKNSGAFSVVMETQKTINSSTDLLNLTSLTENYLDFSALIAGQVIYEDNKYKVKYSVWDIYNNKLLIAKSFEFCKLDEEITTYLAHHISNNIYKAFIGENGFFNSKIAFVSNNTIYIMDYDGDNIKPLIKSDIEIFTPVFSNNNKLLAYITLNQGVSEIYVYDLNKNKSYKLGNFKDLVLAPRFSNDNKFMLFAVSKDGCTNIFKLNLLTKQIIQLTYSYSINIPGGFSPDDYKIVFTSDRSGFTNIYTMDNDGNNVKKISQSPVGGYSTPKWSPRGDLIAFTKITKGKLFNIGIMDEAGNREKQIDENYFAEGPSWSSNGRNLVYQYMYEAGAKKFSMCLINLANGYKITLKPFENIKDPSLSNNFIYDDVINIEKDLL